MVWGTEHERIFTLEEGLLHLIFPSSFRAAISCLLWDGSGRVTKAAAMPKPRKVPAQTLQVQRIRDFLKSPSKKYNSLEESTPSFQTQAHVRRGIMTIFTSKKFGSQQTHWVLGDART